MSDTQIPAQDTNDAGDVNTEGQQADTGVTDKTETPADNTQQTEVSYEFEAPEGTEIDQPSLDEFKSIAKELGLPKEGAQKLFDLAAKREVARANAFAQQVEDWRAEVNKDPELSKPENQAIAAGVIKTFGGQDVVDLMNSGWGNHPAFVRMAFKIGKAMSEDKIVRGNDAAPVADPAAAMYPSMKQS